MVRLLIRLLYKRVYAMHAFCLSHLTFFFPFGTDPRCHDEPSRPVLEPTPGPTPYPDPPTNDRIVELTTTAPPPEVPCTGDVTGFAIVDLNDDSNVIPLENGADLVQLSDLPASFTIKAITSADDFSPVE